ncbi:TIGR00153 family protein [Thiocystis violacea]|uniref:TIGR00153 family protein n=1 Tax=Thiocystis violacea TaxID=13725 RepID=UPI0019038C83|nr:TIGR00153 family protein [Thiocystis violacea]MBK1720787.1 TIGR00153 family protein [Thiocystis violacea]
MKSTNPIAALFGRSPFKPMQEHMHLVQDCVAQIPALIEAAIAGDTARLEQLQAAIFAQEERADDIKGQIRLHLPRSLFMPVDRRDLLDLLKRQDRVASAAQDIAGLLVQRRIQIPAAMQPDLKAMAEHCTAACRQATTIIDELDELVETGFRGREAARVEGMIPALERLGQETDTLGMALARTLFGLENQLDPVSVMLLYQIVRWLGKLADRAEKVGDHLLLLIAR